MSKKQNKLLDGEEYTNKMREHEEATRPHIEAIHRQGFHQILREKSIAENILHNEI